MNENAGTDLYRRVLCFDYGDSQRSELMAAVWQPTPWMVDAYTGYDSREEEILEWCRDRFGQQCSPIHEIEGTWHRGSATINGWTWFGFSTEDQMREFVAAWPTPEEAK